jgi:PAS domain S-box-containing protein
VLLLGRKIRGDQGARPSKGKEVALQHAPTDVESCQRAHLVACMLIVDDNPANRLLLVRLLEPLGHSVLEAADGAEALALVSREHPHLVIADILMPTMDGYEFVRQLRANPEIASTPVMFWTAHYREREAQDLARECGVDHVLTKPCEQDLVLRTVDACLNGVALASAPILPESFDQEHLRLLTNKLSEETAKLTAVNLRLEALVEASLEHTSKAHHGPLLEDFCKSARQLLSAKYALVGVGPEGTGPLDQFCFSGVDLELNPIVRDSEFSHQVISSLLEGRNTMWKRNRDGNPEALGFSRALPRFESLLAARITSPARAYGWLCLFHRLGMPEFSEEDERLARLLGAPAGRIYENRSFYAVAQRQAADLKKAKEAAEDAVERLNLALRASRTGIWTWDAVDDLIVWDENTCEMFGLPRGNVAGTLQDFVTLIHEDDRAAVLRAVEQCTPKQSGYASSFRVVWPDASIHYLDASGRAFYNHADELIRVTGTSRDISEQRLLEEQFRQAQKMEAVGQLAGGIAHDFNNVLTVIIGYSRMVLASSALDDPDYRRIEEIAKAGERAAALTQQLLAFGRKQVLRPRVVNLADTLKDMDQMIRRVIGENIEISTTVDDSLAQVKIDPAQVQHVLMNLVVNARDAMPLGGKLRLELMNQEVDESAGRVHGVPAGKYLMLGVSDNGEGMTPEVRQHVFEPFFTTKEVGRGTGLGLAPCMGLFTKAADIFACIVSLT